MKKRIVIRPAEVRPEATGDTEHIGVGSGWEERGGGHSPEENPWDLDPPYRNPAQDGAGGDHSDEFQLTRR